MPCTAVVQSDPTLLRMILQNLISNAIKYTHQGSVVIGCERCGDQLSIEVRDSGIGIPEAMQDMIFEELHQAHNQARDRSKGTGIGLAIVKRISDLPNHPVHMHSVEGEGRRESYKATKGKPGRLMQRLPYTITTQFFGSGEHSEHNTIDMDLRRTHNTERPGGYAADVTRANGPVARRIRLRNSNPDIRKQLNS